MFIRKLTICVSFAIGLAVLIPVVADAQKIELRSAKIYIRETPPQWDKALTLLNTALEKDPENNDAHFLLGLIHNYQGRFDQMFEHWNMVAFKDLDRKDKDVYKDRLNSLVRSSYQVGVQSYEKGEYTDAVDYYSRSVAATEMLQDVLRSTGKKDDGENADKLETARQQSYLYWGYAALGAEDNEQARVALEKLLELDPDKFEAWDGLVNVYYTGESWDKLITASNKVIALSEEVDLNTYLILRNAYFGPCRHGQRHHNVRKSDGSFSVRKDALSGRQLHIRRQEELRQGDRGTRKGSLRASRGYRTDQDIGHQLLQPGRVRPGSRE